MSIMSSEQCKEFVARIPKIELHLHIEGAIPLETMLALILRNNRFDGVSERIAKQSNICSVETIRPDITLPLVDCRVGERSEQQLDAGRPIIDSGLEVNSGFIANIEGGQAAF